MRGHEALQFPLHLPANPSPPSGARGQGFVGAHEAALLLESARTCKASNEAGAFKYMHALLATFLLTGARKSEVFGLEVDDVSLQHGKIYFRPNNWRRMKTRGSERSMPLWPQLEEILRAYLMEREPDGGIEGSLLFPSGRGGDEECMLDDVRKALGIIVKRAGFKEGQIRLHGLRHTYTAARIQTCHRGRPVSLYTVARELGHRSTDMIEERYGHLHDRTEEGCSEVVEFRIEAHPGAAWRSDHAARGAGRGGSRGGVAPFFWPALVTIPDTVRVAEAETEKPGKALSPCRASSSPERETGLEPATLSLGS